MSESKPLLVELGCEELPANQVQPLAEQLANQVCEHLKAEGLLPSSATPEIYATPRRLAFVVNDVAATQPEQVLERKGPAVSAAFDSEGNPTPAAQGFAKSVGKPIDEIERLSTEQGEWLFAKVIQAGQPLATILETALETTIKQMASAKSMRWHDGDERFVRPVRWLVALHGESVVPIQAFGLTASNQTQGHRIHSPGVISLDSAKHYGSTLVKAFVQPDIQARREKIASGVDALAKAEGFEVDHATKESLVDENANLTEWPVALLGSFDDRFLEVPEPALISAMQLHQKCFPLRRKEDQSLSGHFIAVANIESQDVSAMRSGFERVIRPRLADAQFFWDQDCQTPLRSRAPQLQDVLFQKDLGSIWDKVDRLKTIAPWLASELNVDASELTDAMTLSKCDLLTEMVGEFPELQGVMGRYYAAYANEPTNIAFAIEQHYWPKHAGDRLPTTPLAAALALADRADTLVGIFGVGLKPKGSKDPFALRRAAQGLVRILENYPQLSLKALLAKTVDVVGDALSWPESERPQHLEAVEAFCLDRARSYLAEQEISTPTINAVFAVESYSIADLVARARAVEGLLAHQSIDQLIAVNKRLANLLSKTDASAMKPVESKWFSEPEEEALFEVWSVQKTSVAEHIKTNDYANALSDLANLADPLDRFFDKVMVMADDDQVRINRLSLLHEMRQSFLSIADLAQLGR